MKLIVVTPPSYFIEEDKIITALFEEGLDILHIRKPEIESVFLERLLTLIPQKYHNRIVIHEHFHLLKEYALKGIHLNHRYPIKPNNYMGHTSCSCHTLDEINTEKPIFNYVFMSPIFKNMCDNVNYKVYTSEEFRLAHKQKIIDSKVMALGGINLDNIMII